MSYNNSLNALFEKWIKEIQKRGRVELAINEMSKYAVDTIAINLDLCRQKYHGRLGEDYFKNIYSFIEKTIIDAVGLNNPPKITQIKKPWHKRIFSFHLF